MAKFLTGRKLEETIFDIIEHAEKSLLLVSPYIKLDNFFKDLFDRHLNRPELKMMVVFGKNEGEVDRSMGRDSFEYFKRFPNISIVYVPNLHAKYYGNDRKGVITSINLYDYSFQNNIEYGVFSEVKIWDKLLNTSNIDEDAWQYSLRIAHENECIFARRPSYEKKWLGKKYREAQTIHDLTKDFYTQYGQPNRRAVRRIGDFPDELEFGKPYVPPAEPTEGYCIRTGVKIPFDPLKPYSLEAYRVWAQYQNPDYPESFCHRTGRRSNGKTSMRYPIL